MADSPISKSSQIVTVRCENKIKTATLQSSSTDEVEKGFLNGTCNLILATWVLIHRPVLDQRQNSGAVHGFGA